MRRRVRLLRLLPFGVRTDVDLSANDMADDLIKVVVGSCGSWTTNYLSLVTVSDLALNLSQFW